VPLLPAAREHAQGASFGGLERNRAHFLEGGRVRFDGVEDVLRTLLLDPQTSGGLLVGVPAAHADAWELARAKHGVSATRIGEVTEGQGVIVTA
jgi:selenide,water dikinase